MTEVASEFPAGLPPMGEAISVGPANVNPTPLLEQRSATGAEYIPKTDGPRLGAEGEFLPAEYPKLAYILSGPDENPITVECIRRDR